MKKLIIFIILVLAVILIIRYAKKSSVVAPEPGSTTTTTTQQPPVPVTTTPPTVSEPYIGSTFSFLPAKGYTVSNTDTSTQWRMNTQSTGTLLALVTIPREFQPKTNFSEAKFTVGMSAQSSATRDCLVATNGEVAKGTVVINGVTFNKFMLGDAGAGNYYDTTSYRTKHGTSCYAVEYTIHSTNIANYDPSMGIKAFDAQAVNAALEGMVQSFKFN